MDLVTARAKAISEMKKHGLVKEGWTFEFDRAVRRLGQCNSEKKRITISKHFTGEANEDEFEQALLHEIAHALLPVEARHGWHWQRKAREIGYRGSRLANNPYRKVYEAQKREERLSQRSVAGNEKV